MWLENYRPDTLDEVIGHKILVKKLKALSQSILSGDNQKCPHIALFGMQGTGKTTMVYAFLKDTYGQRWKGSLLELNASDENSIDVVRNKVKKFAKSGVVGDTIFNFVFLDEADALTPQAQTALRRIMERNARRTKFILTANYPHKLIEPIKDRLAFSEYRFLALKDVDLAKILGKVVKGEGLRIDEDACLKIIELSKGSARRCINLLYVASLGNKKIRLKNINEIHNSANDNIMGERLFIALRKRKFDQSDKLIEEAHWGMGFSHSIILKSLFECVQKSSMTQKEKINKIKRIGDYLYYCEISSDPVLQLKCFAREW